MVLFWKLWSLDLLWIFGILGFWNLGRLELFVGAQRGEGEGRAWPLHKRNAEILEQTKSSPDS